MSRGYAGIGLYSPKTDMNVGGAMRAAFCYGASFVAVQGARYKRQPTDTLAAHRNIPVFQAESLLDMMPIDCARVAVEILPTAHPLPNFAHPTRAIYIFGPEDGSIPADIVSRCKYKVYVPTNRCMNLAATVNVILYDRMVKNSRRYDPATPKEIKA